MYLSTVPWELLDASFRVGEKHSLEVSGNPWCLCSFGAMTVVGKRSIATVPKQQPKPDTLPVLRGLTDQYRRRHVQLFFRNAGGFSQPSTPLADNSAQILI